MRKFIKISSILLGSLAILAAVPAAFLAEISIAGCCGAPSNGREGYGFALGGFVGVAGIVLLIFGIRSMTKSQK